MSREARHSSNSSLWTSPPAVVEKARELFGGRIDLDPASSARSNRIIQAGHYYTKRENGLKQPWKLPGRRLTSGWLNPPGGWHNGRVGDSELKHWWLKLLIERQQKYFGDWLFLAFSMEAAQTTQVGCEMSLLDFPSVFFSRRLQYLDPVTLKPVTGNTHGSCLTYIPGRRDRSREFYELFREMGVVVKPYAE